MNWIQRLFCPNSEVILNLKAESAIRAEAVKKLSEENKLLKQENRQLIQNGILAPNFSFDLAKIKAIERQTLYSILVSKFPHAEIKLADNQYQYTTLAEVQRWASFDPTNELLYRAEIMDCDKFALTDMAAFRSENQYQLGNGVFGICWGESPTGSHAWNIAFVEEGILMLEPQTDKIWNWEDDTSYKPGFIYI